MPSKVAHTRRFHRTAIHYYEIPPGVTSNKAIRLDRLRTKDEKHFIGTEKRYFGKLSLLADTSMHAEQFKIVNVENNEELASVGA